jgi:hypothetical protein
VPGGAAEADHGPFLTQDGYGLPKNRWKHAQPCWPEKPQAQSRPWVRTCGRPWAGFAADRRLARQPFPAARPGLHPQDAGPVLPAYPCQRCQHHGARGHLLIRAAAPPPHRPLTDPQLSGDHPSRDPLSLATRIRRASRLGSPSLRSEAGTVQRTAQIGQGGGRSGDRDSELRHRIACPTGRGEAVCCCAASYSGSLQIRR